MELGRFEELGSGVFNINRFIKVYSDHNNPQFIEGHIFKTIIPFSELAVGDDSYRMNDKINDMINDRIKSGDIKNPGKAIRNKLCKLAEHIYMIPHVKCRRISFENQYFGGNSEPILTSP